MPLTIIVPVFGTKKYLEKSFDFIDIKGTFIVFSHLHFENLTWPSLRK